MTPCPVCGGGRPKNPWVTGFWFDGDRIVGVAFLCGNAGCANNRSIPLDEASTEEKDRALFATKSRFAKAG